MTDENEKPEKVLASCPVCKTKIRQGDKIINSIQVVVIASNKLPQPELPQIVCLNCGVKFFAPEIMELLKKRLNGEEPRIVTPEVKLVGTC